MSVEHAWRQQRIWSAVARGLKRDLQRGRDLVLTLTVIGALLSAAAVVAELKTTPGKVLAAAGAAAVALAGIARQRSGQDAVRAWTRSRSVAEGLKSEVYLYQARVGDYDTSERDRTLDKRVEAIERAAADLTPLKAGIDADTRPLPAVSDTESYVRERIASQITDYYRPQAADLRRRIARLRAVELGLAVTGALVGAAAAVFETDNVAVWVPVVTTVAAAVAAHGAAERYEFMLVEYTRTADELERLRERRGTAADFSDDELIRAAEHVISVQNEGWMVKLSGDEDG